MEHLPKTEYPEFDFAGHFAGIAKCANEISERFEDPAEQRIALVQLLEETQQVLFAEDLINTEARVGVGARVAESSEDGYSIRSVTEPITGQYAGLILINEHFDEGIDYSRYEIAHRVLIESRSMNNGFIDYDLKCYAIIPIDQPGLEIIRAAPAYSPGETWLRQVFQPIYNSEHIDYGLIARTFDRIQTAPQSRGVLDQHNNWCIDQLNELLPVYERGITAYSRSRLEQTGDVADFFQSDEPEPVEGYSLGFCLMPKYNTATDTPTPTDDLVLGICIETVNTNDAYCLAKIPVGSVTALAVEQW